jgi:hypothetical protein
MTAKESSDSAASEPPIKPSRRLARNIQERGYLPYRGPKNCSIIADHSVNHPPCGKSSHSECRFAAVCSWSRSDQYRNGRRTQDQSLADHRPIASLARLWCYRLIVSDPIGRAQEEFFRKEATMTAVKKTPSVLGWYRILRVHYAFTSFQALRYALWLAR